PPHPPPPRPPPPPPPARPPPRAGRGCRRRWSWLTHCGRWRDGNHGQCRTHSEQARPACAAPKL
ncbi:hypothetical protein, partial [Nocardia brasiliensis]|uniref:hypothetical protein n=1 Tax=Nocardia brasiliensis TaxID=37326 RepID=UPI002456E67A